MQAAGNEEATARQVTAEHLHERDEVRQGHLVRRTRRGQATSGAPEEALEGDERDRARRQSTGGVDHQACATFGHVGQVQDVERRAEPDLDQRPDVRRQFGDGQWTKRVIAPIHGAEDNQPDPAGRGPERCRTVAPPVHCCSTSTSRKCVAHEMQGS